MSRFKFRAWNPGFPGWGGRYIYGTNVKMYIERGYEIEQCIGQKDREGKDVYEGDIIKLWTWDFKGGFMAYSGIYEVSYSDFFFGYKVYPIDLPSEGAESDLVFEEFECLVIGNIRKNPELIESNGKA